MICAGDTLADGGATEVEVAIVGAGPLGIAIATCLEGRVGRIAIIEAGDAHFNHAQNLQFFRASQINDPRHTATELNRRRMLGGTSSIWGGRCIPFDPEDFAPTRMRSGWPMAYAEMETHIAEALDFLDAGDSEFSAASALPKHAASLELFASDLAIDRIERYSKPTNLWRKWHTQWCVGCPRRDVYECGY
jgi:choline dehydrogenase-like flavoprotein